MELKNNRKHYTSLEKQELVEQWKQSGKSKLAFSKEIQVSYFTLCHWVKGRDRSHKAKTRSSFLPVEIKPETSKTFAHLILKSGTSIQIHQPVESSYLVALLKA
jgi:transposase-like protein